MSSVVLSDSFCLHLSDGDIVWPSTVDGSYRTSDGGLDHNVLGKGEHDVSESVMIDSVLNHGMVSRFRSKTNPPRIRAANHFSIHSPSVTAVFVFVGGVAVRLRHAV